MKFKYQLNTGIEFQDFPGIVPRYYEIAAAHAANYRYYHEWQELEREQKALIVAHFYMTNIVNSHRDEAVHDKVKKDQRKKRG